MKSPARDTSRSLLKPQRWEQSLSDIHRQLPSDSLIPMFEGMVDLALSRTQPETPVVREQRVATAAPWDVQSSPGGFRLPAVRASSKT